MSEAAMKQFIKTAPFEKVAVLEKLFVARRQEEQEKAEIDAAITRGLESVKAGRVYTAEEVDKHLKEYIAELESKKCHVAA